MLHVIAAVLCWVSITSPVTRVRDTAGNVVLPMMTYDHPATVFFFIGVDCPISNSYAPEMNRIVADYRARGVRAYMVYADEELSASSAESHSTAFKFACPSLMDSHGLLVERFGPRVTPEAVVVDRAGRMVYRGRIDDWYAGFGRQRQTPTTHELRDALDAVLAGKVPRPATTRPVGCPI